MKAIEDRGHCAEATKPLRLRRYEAGKLPDPGQNFDCVIIVNDRTNPGNALLALSTGTHWELFEKAGTSAPERVDITPLVRQAVADAVGCLPQIPAIAPPERVPDRRVALLEQRVKKLEAMVEYISLNAVAAVDLKVG